MDSTTIKALLVIEALSLSEEPRGVADLSRQLGYSKSNVFRILSTLASQGFVRSHPETGRYTLTLKIWEQGVRVIDRLPVRRVAQSHLKMLFLQLNETILLSVLDLPDVFYIDKVEGDYPVRASARVGWRAPAWRTASGKSLLAYQSDDVVSKMISEIAEKGLFPKDGLPAFKNELDEVRQRGFAFSFNGSRPGINSVSAPIWGPERFPIAALSASGPAERFSPERMMSMSSSVMNAATRISESLGATAPQYGLKTMEGGLIGLAGG
ncbi:MAG: IclR family transcriptional regulator [Candidatus Acidiferrales bacterium]|jgi:DNA-binding IclR family transcriptional regulator